MKLSSQSGEKGVVLVVDDDPFQADQIASFLQKRGVSVTVETNGFAAVQAMKRLRPVVVVMDVKMPGLDGIEAARLASHLDPKPKIILISGYPDAVSRANRAHVEVFAAVDKPVPLPILVKFIRKALSLAPLKGA
jgi:CheY-like chemotaxis protein